MYFTLLHLRITASGYMYMRPVVNPVLLKTWSVTMNERRPEERQGASARTAAVILSRDGLFSSNLQNGCTRYVCVISRHSLKFSSFLNSCHGTGYSRRLSPWRPGFNPRPGRAVFVVNKETLRLGFLEALRGSPVSTISLKFHICYRISHRLYIISAIDSVVNEVRLT